MHEISLERRTGLPDALRYLLEDYPRNSWESHQEFHGLVSFWLDRHLLFRDILNAMRTQTDLVLDRAIEFEKFAGQLSRYARLFVGQLHGHHHIEDTHFFPLLMERDSRLQQGFTMLDADHQELDNQLHQFIDATNLVFDPPSGTDRFVLAGQFSTVLDQLEKLLDRHLADEEDLVVPLILKYGGEDLY